MQEEQVIGNILTLSLNTQTLSLIMLTMSLKHADIELDNVKNADKISRETEHEAEENAKKAEKITEVTEEVDIKNQSKETPSMAE